MTSPFPAVPDSQCISLIQIDFWTTNKHGQIPDNTKKIMKSCCSTEVKRIFKSITDTYVDIGLPNFLMAATFDLHIVLSSNIPFF